MYYTVLLLRAKLNNMIWWWWQHEWHQNQQLCTKITTKYTHVLTVKTTTTTTTTTKQYKETVVFSFDRLIFSLSWSLGAPMALSLPPSMPIGSIILVVGYKDDDCIYNSKSIHFCCCWSFPFFWLCYICFLISKQWWLLFDNQS